MARIYQEVIAVTISKIVRDDAEDGALTDTAMLTDIEQLIEGRFQVDKDTIIVEASKIEDE